MYTQPTDEQLKELMQSTKSIAVVGISDKTDRASYRVAAYMQRAGYRIVPVNPRLEEVLGEKAFRSLEDIPFPVDMVNVFRRSEETVPFAQQAAAIKAKSIWLQLGISNDEVYKIASEAGLEVVMDLCLMVEHNRLSE